MFRTDLVRYNELAEFQSERSRKKCENLIRLERKGDDDKKHNLMRLINVINEPLKRERRSAD